MGISDLTASDTPCPLEMRMRSYDWAVADRVQVVEQDLCEFSVTDSLAIVQGKSMTTLCVGSAEL